MPLHWDFVRCQRSLKLKAKKLYFRRKQTTHQIVEDAKAVAAVIPLIPLVFLVARKMVRVCGEW